MHKMLSTLFCMSIVLSLMGEAHGQILQDAHGQRFEIVQSLGHIGELKVEQLSRRNCQTFTNMVLVRSTEGDPFVSPDREGLREIAHKIADALVQRCLGDSDRVQIVDLYTVAPGPVGELDGAAGEVLPLAKVSGIGRQRSFEISDDALRYTERQRRQEASEEMACETGSITYTDEPSTDGWGELPAHWEGVISGAKTTFDENGEPVREYRDETAVKLRVTEDGRPLLRQGHGNTACQMLLVPEGQDADVIAASTRSFQVEPRGKWCDDEREVLQESMNKESGDIEVTISTLEDKTLHLKFTSRSGRSKHFGSYSTETYEGRLGPEYPSCVAPPTPEELRRRDNIVLAYWLLLGIAATQDTAADRSGNCDWCMKNGVHPKACGC